MKLFFALCFVFSFISFSALFAEDKTPSSKSRYKGSSSTPSMSLWDQVSSGAHSYKALGEDFYVPLEMQKIEGAELVLFNQRVAKSIGLDSPEDIKELEKLILDRFAYMHVPETSVDQGAIDDTKEWIATRYLDSYEKGPGEALGDGRAAWSGELVIDTSKGEKRHIDFVLKGIGPTPLAWTNHTLPTHKDGLQGLKEAIHSYIVSEANSLNRLNTTVDLAVIKLPIKRIDKEGKEVYTAITVRVGGQTRVAHLRYFADNPRQFKKITDYIIRRDTGLSQTSKITQAHLNTFLLQYTDNLAAESARYYDLHITHGSPTYGNRTTTGTSIDLSTQRYHEAHHGNYIYLNSYLMSDQIFYMKRYISLLVDEMKFADYPFLVNPEDLEKRFVAQLSRNLAFLWLRRLGLNVNEIQKVSDETKKKFVLLLDSLHDLTGTKEIVYAGKKMFPAGLNIRRIFANTAGAEIAEIKGDRRAYEKIFRSNSSWESLSDAEKSKWVKKYRKIYKEIVKHLEPTSEKRQKWSELSRYRTKENSEIRGQSNLKNRELVLIEDIVSQRGDLSLWTQRANSMAAELKDPDLPRGSYNNLGPKSENTRPRICDRVLN